MNEQQAREVLRVTAEHALTMMPYLYGKHHQVAAEVIKEALLVDKVAHEKTKE
jgi:hypothetical protein